MELWPTDLALKAYDLKIAEPHEHVIIGTQSPNRECVVTASGYVSRLLRLICSLPDRFFAGNIREMARKIGVSNRSMGVLQSFKAPLSSDVFARGDLLISERIWKLVEINIGSLVGSMFDASLPRLSGYPQEGDVLKEWARITIRKWNIASRTAFVVDNQYIEEARKPLAVMIKEFESYSGNEVVLLAPNNLAWDGKRLNGPTGPIDYIYCRFDENTILNSTDSYAPIISALAARKICCPMGLSYNILGSKGTLALLWELAKERRLTPPETKLIFDFVAKTEWLSWEKLDEYLKKKNQLVLKPIDGWGGRDVLCGIETSGDLWEQRLRDVLTENRENYVIQKYIDSKPQDVCLANIKGVSQFVKSRIVWGLFVYGEKFLGGYLRSQPSNNSLVINVNRGASKGPMPILSRDPESKVDDKLQSSLKEDKDYEQSTKDSRDKI